MMNISGRIALASVALIAGGIVVAQPYFNVATGEVIPAETTSWGRCPNPTWEVFSYIPPQGGANEPVVLLGTGVVHAIILDPKERGESFDIYLDGFRGQGGPMNLKAPTRKDYTTSGALGGFGSEVLILDAIFGEAIIISGSVEWSDSEQAWVPTGKPPAFTLLWKSDV
jgi:hypothetical protein